MIGLRLFQITESVAIRIVARRGLGIDMTFGRRYLGTLLRVGFLARVGCEKTRASKADQA